MEEKEKNIKNRSKWGERKREGEKDGWCWNAREAKPPRLPTPSLIQSTSTARGCVRGGPVVHTRPSVGGRRWLCSLQHSCAPAPSVRGFQFQNSTAPPPRLGKPRHRLAIARLARRSAQARDGHAEAISSFCLVCACVTAWALTTEQAKATALRASRGSMHMPPWALDWRRLWPLCVAGAPRSWPAPGPLVMCLKMFWFPPKNWHFILWCRLA